MNSFGRLFRLTLLGASHGPGVGVVIDGCPAGLELSPDDLGPALARRRSGAAGTSARREPDEPQLLAGVWQGRTTGAPLLIWFDNRDVDSSDYQRLRQLPRPGHADLTARQRYGPWADTRGGGVFSGRLTAGLVAAGAVARKLLAGVAIGAELVAAGGRAELAAAVAAAAAERDSVGGLVACRVTGLPPGLGEPWFDALESLLAHLIFAIPGVRGLEFGAGMAAAGMRGSQANDPILDRSGRSEGNAAGGCNGGLSNGNPIELRVAFKPTATIGRPQRTVDLSTGQPAVIEAGGRHDACFALRTPVIVESACAVVLADLLLQAQRIPRVLDGPDLPEGGG